MLESRNTTLGFAKRTRKNLVNVKQAFESGKDFHVVTHLVNSLLGIVVVPKQRYCKAEFLSLPLEEIYRDGWPRWDITLDEPKGNQGKTEILERLITHLRNAAAHGRFSFHGDPDSRNLKEVWLVVEDRPGEKSKTNWLANIRGDELFGFCIRLCDHIEDSVE